MNRFSRLRIALLFSLSLAAFLTVVYQAKAQEKLTFATGSVSLTGESVLTPVDADIDREAFFDIFIQSSDLIFDGNAVIQGGENLGEIEGQINLDLTETFGGDYSFDGDLDLGFRTTRFSLDPVEAGPAAILTVNYTLENLSKSGATASLSLRGTQLQTVTATSTPTTSAQIVTVPFGQFPEHNIFLRTTGRSTRSGAEFGTQGEVNFLLAVLEIRNHWDGSSFGNLADTSRWIEKLIPTPIQYACFNREFASDSFLSLGDFGIHYRGLIVDGSKLDLDLNVQTLTLGGVGPSVKTYNILVGEGRKRPSDLRLSNGSVTLQHGFVVAGLANQNATLAIVEDATITRLNGAPSLGVVGDQGNGTLTLEGNASVSLGSLVVGNNAGSRGTVTGGEGSQLITTALIAGRFGQGDITLGASSSLAAQTFAIGSEPGGPGSISLGENATFSVGEGVSQIGSRATATLELAAGTSMTGNGTLIGIGADFASHASVLRSTGGNLSEIGFILRDNALLHLRDGASWTALNIAENQLEQHGGETLIQNATAHLQNALIEGGLARVLSNGHLQVDSVVGVGPGTTLEVNGTGAKISGFDVLSLNGTLNVSSGGELFGADPEENNGVRGTIGVGGTGIIRGSDGVIHADVFVGAGGQIQPGNSPGTLTINGDLVLDPGAILRLEIAGDSPGETFDRLIVQGSLSASDATIELAFINGFAPSAAQDFTLIETTGPVTGLPTFIVTGVEGDWSFTSEIDSETGTLIIDSISDAITTDRHLRILDFAYIKTPTGYRATGSISGAIPGRTIALQSTTNLAVPESWTTLQSLQPDSEGAAAFTIETSYEPLPKFFRVEEIK